MPHQIPFTVVFASSEEERHPAGELNRHEPTVRGWQSARGCRYPQELVLRLHAPASLRRVQVLAHQCLIPERIELWVGTEDSWRDGQDKEKDKESHNGHNGDSHNGDSHSGDGGGSGAGAGACDRDPDGDHDEAESDATPFMYLGFITLSDNQGTGFKSRELKSVCVPPCAGSYLKLRLHRNHPNQYNRYNQVGLIAVNILGDEVDAEAATNGKISSPLPDGTGGGAGADSSASPYDDLAFQMYVDQDAAQIIREMETRKLVAVQDERFEYARKLKDAQAQLHAAGERLARMTLDKRAAIAAEDYGRARTLKTTIDQLRDRLYKELAVDDLLEKNGPVAKNDQSPEEEAGAGAGDGDSVDGEGRIRGGVLESEVPVDEHAPSPQLLHAPASPMHCGLHRSTASSNSSSPPQRASPAPSRSGLPMPIINPPTKDLPPGVRGSLPLRRRLKSAPATSVGAVAAAAGAGAGHGQHSTSHSAAGAIPHSASSASTTPTARGGGAGSYESYEDRPLPALRHGPPEPDHSETSTRPRSKLNEREKKQAALPISVFGVEMVEKIYSKHFADKEEGLRRLKNVLCDASNSTPSQPNKTARAAIFLLHRALRDKVFSVYSLAAEVIRLFFTTYVPGRVSPAEVGRSVERLLPELLLKSGDSTPRIHNMAVHTILSMADVEQVRALNSIPATLTRPMQAATHPRLALSRLEMVEQLIINHGISQDKHSGMTCRTLAELGAQGLQHPAEAVRKVAERVLVLVYRVNPRLVRKQLPPDDDITRRNLLYRQLYTDFDAIDVQRKREMQERQREEESSSSPAPAPARGWPTGTAAMSASWHQGAAASSHAHSPAPSPSPRPGIRRSTTPSQHKSQNGLNVMSSSMSASMCQSWTNGVSKSGSGSSSSSGSIASPAEPAVPRPGAAVGVGVGAGDADLKSCEFCGAASENADSLNSHYWRACPLLTRCNECQHVVEIACLAVHLTEECELRALYRRCGGCTEAVPLQRMQLHVSSCRRLGAGCRRCPLCHVDVREGEAPWHAHLMGPTAKLCAAHPRLKYARSVRSRASLGST